jgi:hypothetical protein
MHNRITPGRSRLCFVSRLSIHIQLSVTTRSGCAIWKSCNEVSIRHCKACRHVGRAIIGVTDQKHRFPLPVGKRKALDVAVPGSGGIKPRISREGFTKSITRDSNGYDELIKQASVVRVVNDPASGVRCRRIALGERYADRYRFLGDCEGRTESIP